MSHGSEIAQAIGEAVDKGHIAGAATLIWSRGEVVESTCVGWQDVAARRPIQRDNLFRIASMTKAITSATALMLLDEGRFTLDDPIVRWAPEFANSRVLRSGNGPLSDTVSAKRAITFRDLLTHTSGLTYGSFHAGPLATAYRNALGDDVDTRVALNDWIAGLSALPLIDQPGANFHYGHSTDLLGLLIGRIEDRPLGDVLERRLFGPLGMRDTGFVVAPQQADRCANMYGFDQSGQLIPRPLPERPLDLTFVSGGDGLWSTLDDYLVFARMLVGGGTVDGVRLLRPETCRMMCSNQLTPAQRSDAELMGLPAFAVGHGFGMGVAVVLEPEKAEPTLCGGGVGSFGWPGAYGGWWQVDPSAESILIFLAHNRLDIEQFEQGQGFGVYGAIRKFQALASRRNDLRR